MSNSHGTACAPKTNGHGRINRLVGTLETITAKWTCVKRDGTTVPFKPEKIRHAVSRCFDSEASGSDPRYSPSTIEKIARGVIFALSPSQDPLEGTLKIDVETVQRYVVQQLFANELFEAGEHYQNYREEHRKQRLDQPVSAEVQARFDRMQQHFPTDLQIYQFMSKFSRWDDAKGRRETWEECVDERVMPWLKKEVKSAGKVVYEHEWAEMRDAMYALEASPAMRVVQMAGPALDRCHVGAYNCAYAPIDDIFAFPEMLYILMQGTGHGFSVEDEYIEKLPRIAKQKGSKKDTLVVADSTTGWCDTYYEALQRWMDGYDCDFDDSQVRKKGTRLKTKGGRASGPEPLRELLDFSRNVIFAKQGRYLEDTDAHRIACFTGRIVQVGGVRRAAMMSLSELGSAPMRGIKSGAWYADTTCWQDGRYLSMSNNSAVYDFEEGQPPIETFTEEWLALMKSKSGERGIFNRRAVEMTRPARRQGGFRWGCNPCAEIQLRPNQFCNLSIAVARAWDTVQSLLKKVRIAAMFGMVQSLLTKFGYIRPSWKANCEDERLLGVDVTGHADCPLLKYGAPGREALQQQLKAEVAKISIAWSQRFGINRPAADTAIKPAGDSAILFDAGSGVSARHSEFQLRWVREGKDSPVSKFLIASGVPYADAPEAPTMLNCFAFPKAAPKGAVLRNDMTAIDQFRNWLEWKNNYAEHSVSTTINIEDHEWLELGAEVYKNIDKVTGCAFLPKDNGSYRYAPNEELTKEQYEEFCRNFPKLNWAKLPHYEETDQTESSMTYACVGGVCER